MIPMAISTNSSMPKEAMKNLQTATIPQPRQPDEQVECSRQPSSSNGQIDLVALRDSLSSLQRTGRACVQCGRSDLPLQPAGILLDIKVVECYSHGYDRRDAASPAHWLAAGPCPPWCDDIHHGGDHPEDREHGSSYLDTTLQTLPYDNYRTSDNPEFKPVIAMARLTQNYREAEPRICFTDTRDKSTTYMTLDEAQEIVLNWMTLIVAGRERAEIFEPPAAVSERAGCHPWCRDHRTEDTCDSSPLDKARLTYDADDGALIWFDGFGDDGHTVAQAERLVSAILRTTVLARRSQASGPSTWRDV